MKAKLFVALFVLLSAAPAAAATATSPQKLTLPPWSGQKVLKFGAVTLQIVMPDAKKKGVIALTISAPETASATLTLAHDPGEHEFLPSLSLVEMDGANATPEFLISRYSGGAHCCAMVSILDLVGDKWSVVDGGTWDGDEIIPEDADGDGELEIVHGDDRFLYMFSCYACAGSPTRTFKLVEGALTDITASPLLRPRDEKELPNFQRGCANHDNEACASYVAIMTRLGRHDEGWQFMLKNYDRKQDWGLTRCAQYNAAGNCIAEIKYQDYPDALDALIHRTNEWQTATP